MSSNLFKSYYLNRNTDNNRIINSNDVIAQKLERIGLVMPAVNVGMPTEGGFEPVDLVGQSPVIDPAAVLSGVYNPEDLSMGVTQMSEMEMVQPPVYTGPSPEELIAQAQEEIESMRLSAQREIESLRINTINSANAQGYEEGKAQAMRELEVAREQLEQERIQMQAMYEEQIDALEQIGRAHV